MANIVIITGRLTNDLDLIEKREGNDTQYRTSFNLAVKRGGRNVQKTDFPRVVVFGNQARACADNIGKGNRVLVEGQIQTNTYVNKDGQKIKSTDIVASRVEFYDYKDSKPGNDRVDAKAEEAPPEDLIPDGFQMIDDDEIPF